MLRKRSRPVSSSKQTIICENNNCKINFAAPNTEKSHKPTSFLFNSPRILKDFFSLKDSAVPNSIMSPSSDLDTKAFWVQKQIQNPNTFSSVKHTQHSWEQPAIGLALIDDHRDEKNPQLGPTNTSKSSKPRSKLVVFGSQMKIQIPTPPVSMYPTSPQSPMEFGIKTPKNNLLGHVFANNNQQEDYYKEKKRLLVTDMELSEDYTCVISHGPNPRTTHIFGNCIVKSGCDVVLNTSKASPSPTNRFSYGLEGKDERQGNKVSHSPENLSFLSFCHHCKKKIGQGKDIYMYRGEKAFCSQECRGQEMLFDGIEC